MTETMADTNQSTIGIVAKELVRALRPLAGQSDGALAGSEMPEFFEVALEAAGITLDRAIGPATVQTIKISLSKISTAYSTVAPIAEGQDPVDLEEVPKLVQAVTATMEALQDLSNLNLSAYESEDVLVEIEDLGLLLLGFLIADYLQEEHPIVFNAALQLGVIALGKSTAVALEDRLTRVRLKSLIKFVQDPTGAAKELYGWGSEDFDPYRLLGPLSFMIESLGFPAIFVYPSEGDPTAKLWDPSVDRPDLQLNVPLFRQEIGVSVQMGFAILPLRSSQGGLDGIAIVPYGAGNQSRTADVGKDWELDYRFSGNVTVNYGVIIRTSGIKIDALDGTTIGANVDLSTSASLNRKVPPGTRTLLFGQSGIGGIEAGSVGVTLGISFENGQASFLIELPIEDARVFLRNDKADGFLQQVLPKEGISAPFALTVSWSSRHGLSFRGGGGLEATLRLGIDLLGILKIDSVFIALRADNNGFRSEAATTATVQLGPVTATVDRFGLAALLTIPPEGGNLGLADLSVTIKPPTGVALAIDAAVVVGGGFLLFDPEKGQYAGAIQLELAETIQLTAFGLLSTRMPDGSPGFSLLILMSATFSPAIQLGYGFTLSGVGGLVGVNRTVAVDTLRAGLRNGALGSVLFPTDPIRNAPQIVSDLQAIFPPAKGRFLFGPMVQLGWGTPTVVTIELGLILELPAPVRLLILGRLRVLLPDERLPVVRLQLDAVGVIDFASGDVSLDAVLYDSQVAQFAVTGAMAMRANFGAKPKFVLAIGGFNPRFPAPAGFPALERVAISLATGDNPRLRLEAYLALTTNTVQFGAHLELYAWAGPFSVDGLLGFDVLMQLVPFGFIADVRANLALKYNGSSVMSVALKMTLTGPNPWRARGTASFTVLFISGSIAFDVRVGAEEKQALPSPVDVRALLEAALSDEDNWTTQVPQGQHPLVSLRERPGSTEQLVHPLADLRVKQRIAPLGREISRFGGAMPKGERVFSLGVMGPDGRLRSTEADGVEAVTDFFAPAQFRNMKDDEKLTAPAFEPMQAGIRFVSTSYDSGKAVIEGDITFARKTIYHPGQAAPAGMARAMAPDGFEVAADLSGVGADGFEDVSISADLVLQVAAVGSAAQAPIARTGVGRYETPVAGVTLGAPQFAVVEGHGLTATVVTTAVAPIAPRPVIGGPAPLRPTPVTEVEAPVPTSYTEAVEALETQLLTRPIERGRLRVVPMYTELEL